MKKQSLLKMLNPLLLLAFLTVAGAAIGLRLGLVPYEVFKQFHPPAGFAFILLAAIHLILNWSWVKAAYSKRSAGGR